MKRSRTPREYKLKRSFQFPPAGKQEGLEKTAMDIKPPRFLTLSGTFMLCCAAANAELLVNGDFEDPTFNGSWQIFDSIPGWQLDSGPSIEVQHGVNGWTAYSGEQWIELDSDENGPGGGSFGGEQGSSAISQDIDTEPGGQYLLTFAFSPRPGINDNRLLVEFGDEVVAELFASGIGLGNTNWQVFEFVVTSSSDITSLRFSDLSQSNTLGTFIDGISLTALPGPAVLGVLLPLLLTPRRRR